MKKAKNVKVGAVVQFPYECFDNRRSGWNGWIFRAAIVERLYVSTSGVKCAEIRYCVQRAGRYQLLPNKEATKRIQCDRLFEYDVEWQHQRYLKALEAENNGEQICWDEDTALLVNNGIF